MDGCTLTVLKDNIAAGELSTARCAGSLMDFGTAQLNLLNLRTVGDCPEDSASCIIISFNLIHKTICDKERSSLKLVS